MDKEPEKKPHAPMPPMVERKSLAMVRTVRDAVVKSAVQPIVSLKSFRINKKTGRDLLGFAVKMAALELIRRHTQIRFPPIWTFVQSLPLLQLPPFSWLPYWGPLKYLLIGSQVFSKPIMVLSIATTVNERYNELRAEEPPTTTSEDASTSDEAAAADSDAIGHLALVTGNIQREQGMVQANGYLSDHLTSLKRELEKLEIALPDRMEDDELERFLEAANNDIRKCTVLVKRNIEWRERFCFLPLHELEKWSSLVFWHGYDVEMRPSLVIRIGWVHTSLPIEERPHFAQAILSQVEYGVTHLLKQPDPRITVIIDCDGAPALGFPVNILKSFCACLQENYPTRLAALFVVNVPPVVRIVAQAIIQVLKPATKKKIFVEGDQYNALVEHYGGPVSMPAFLGGTCTCSSCSKLALTNSSNKARLQLLDQDDDQFLNDEDESDSDELSTEGEVTLHQRFSSVLRAIIVGFLILWVVVSLLAGIVDSEVEFIPT